MKVNKLSQILLLAIFFSGCSARPAPDADSSVPANASTDLIEVYYFHFTVRCVTCLNLEEKTKEFIEELYPGQVKAGLITFKSLNLDDEATKPLVKRLGVPGQSLLIVKGDKKIDLTTEGFLYAMVKPEKFKEIINENIDRLLTE